ncbi:vacuolar-sorting protein SNF8 [Rhodotorula diobovata]|uniref:Vacuolar-sorting protein SNF8 n=1 Tax=Rhodotorula diobovata TaxID=5288 RepID=A0A5C5FSF1_9BASI|nr:vacuolar-sorting protein SNF8 [Rhodotorula diobovata]
MSRRAAGLSSLERYLDQSQSYHSLGTSLAAQQSASLASQLATFQAALSTFSSQHRAKILSSPSFRTHFSQLCAELGVDPLGGGAKGLWDKIGVGDWYYALGVQVVDVCLRVRERSGGLVALDEVIREVVKLRGGGGGGSGRAGGKKGLGGGTSTTSEAATITEADVQRAIEALEPLGCGYAILSVGGGKKVVRCSPGGLDRDSLVVVEAASATGRGVVTREDVQAFTAREEGTGRWDMDRVERALEKALMDDGMVWVDEEPGSSTREYYALGLFVLE